MHENMVALQEVARRISSGLNECILEAAYRLLKEKWQVVHLNGLTFVSGKYQLRSSKR